MSELQIALIAIGALAIAAVLAYNHLQERRARDAARRAFGPGHADVLLESAPAQERSTSVPSAPTPREEPLPVMPILDERLDYVIEIRPGAPLPAPSLQAHWRTIQRRHAARATLSGPDERGCWRAGLQLASRSGSVSEAELIEFRADVESMGAAFGASVRAGETRAALERARQLDALCAETDLQVVLHVMPAPGGAFAGPAIAQAAQAAGLTLERDGRFVQRSAEGTVALALAPREGSRFDSVSLGETVRGALSLELDVPHAADPRRAFETMARLAGHLAAACGGTVVDDNNRPLGEPALATIAGALDAVRARLEAEGIGPGSTLAARLFS